MAWLRATGELDFASTPQLEQSLQDAQLQARLVVLDLRDLTFIDSAGVRAVVDASRRAHRLIVVRGPAAVDFVFDLTGSSGELTILDLGPAEPPVMALLELAQERTTQVG
ncbi:MAG: STAS domain-containing protein [Thermoleophilaceae bacterium]|nr:STAS domain-containing protein [Thermoleophilaceae bacterium]